MLPHVGETEGAHEPWVLADEGEWQLHEHSRDEPTAWHGEQGVEHGADGEHSEAGEAGQRVDAVADEGNDLAPVLGGQVGRSSTNSRSANEPTMGRAGTWRMGTGHRSGVPAGGAVASPPVRRPSFSWRPDWRSVATMAVAALPILVAIVRALATHRTPLGDNGLIALRANDVLTADHPWFGTWTSASLSAGVEFNNPSPLHFEALSLFVKTFGVTAGSVIGAGLLNIAAVVVAVRQGWLAAGRRGEALMAVAAVGLAWALGSEMLTDVWQPHSLVLRSWQCWRRSGRWRRAGGLRWRGRSASAAWCSVPT